MFILMKDIVSLSAIVTFCIATTFWADILIKF